MILVEFLGMLACSMLVLGGGLIQAQVSGFGVALVSAGVVMLAVLLGPIRGGTGINPSTHVCEGDRLTFGALLRSVYTLGVDKREPLAEATPIYVFTPAGYVPAYSVFAATLEGRRVLVVDASPAMPEEVL